MADVLPILWQVLASSTGFHELRVDGQRMYRPVEHRWTFERAIPAWARGDLTVEISACPRRAAEHDPMLGTLPASVVWARLESGKAADLLSRFSPAPTLVLREGKTVKRTVFWALGRPLAYDWAIRANKRVAHALDCPKKHAEPSFMFTPPGCKVDGKLVWPEYVDPESTLFTADQVVGRLREAPTPRDWRAERTAA